MKICTRCKVEKPFTDFCKCSARRDGHQPACKVCMNGSYTRSRNKDLERYKQVQAIRTTANVKRMRVWKEERGCLFCRESFGPCLELHHTDPSQKDMQPSGAIAYSWEAFLVEAAKCVLLCANCHRKVHHGLLVVDAIDHK